MKSRQKHRQKEYLEETHGILKGKKLLEQMSGYPPVQKESWQERSIRARQQYAARNNPLNAPLMARPPMATSGRYFIWYGWKDRKK